MRRRTTPGIRHVAFAGDDIDAVVASLRAGGAELVGEVERYEDSYRLCYVHGPEGIIVEWRSRSAEGSGWPPTAPPASVVVPGAGSGLNELDGPARILK